MKKTLALMIGAAAVIGAVGCDEPGKTHDGSEIAPYRGLIEPGTEQKKQLADHKEQKKAQKPKVQKKAVLKCSDVYQGTTIPDIVTNPKAFRGDYIEFKGTVEDVEHDFSRSHNCDFTIFTMRLTAENKHIDANYWNKNCNDSKEMSFVIEKRELLEMKLRGTKVKVRGSLDKYGDLILHHVSGKELNWGSYAFHNPKNCKH